MGCTVVTVFTVSTHIAECQKPSIEEQHHAEEHEEHSEGGEADANFWNLAGVSRTELPKQYKTLLTLSICKPHEDYTMFKEAERVKDIVGR